MNKEIREKLIEIARLKSTLSYSKLNEQLSLGYDFANDHHRELIGEELGEVSKFELQKGRPLLSVLIVHENDRIQGDGFYKLCQELGYGDWESLKKSKNFEVDHIKECYKFWKDSENFRKYKNDN
ncbi:MAG TPA: hypothetical protein VK808_04315 [Bacteroidia bacterium]|jgi:hypothetical protein|nr:hypothetical protein [Bacteroidia bacterium]